MSDCWWSGYRRCDCTMSNCKRIDCRWSNFRRSKLWRSNHRSSDCSSCDWGIADHRICESRKSTYSSVHTAAGNNRVAHPAMLSSMSQFKCCINGDLLDDCKEGAGDGRAVEMQLCCVLC